MSSIIMCSDAQYFTYAINLERAISNSDSLDYITRLRPSLKLLGRQSRISDITAHKETYIIVKNQYSTKLYEMQDKYDKA